ncbi:Uu.00g110100.m01.CDS01 [Anthostomella pinea]|uniref:Uu.00g110100.m01.CDS01 n=1 Tax=Anthostomella pinea TaxID=933095 RepID=A0AAI8YGD3_9PEZI|nr:Uu.00g110100.m01.CDS01 [Anthostomella pinea]
MSRHTQVSITCHCGTVEQIVSLGPKTTTGPRNINLCHCHTCRHTTGLLCVSYMGIERPQPLIGLAAYQSSTSCRFFCGTCGCHVFRRDDSSDDDEVGEGAVRERWTVATGVVVGRVDRRDGSGNEGVEAEPMMGYARYLNTSSTKDGGLSVFLRSDEGLNESEVCEHWGTPYRDTLRRSSSPDTHDEKSENISAESEGGKTLSASCH